MPVVCKRQRYSLGAEGLAKTGGGGAEAGGASLIDTPAGVTGGGRGVEPAAEAAPWPGEERGAVNAAEAGLGVGCTLRFLRDGPSPCSSAALS
jgi:hypothetical protein